MKNIFLGIAFFAVTASSAQQTFTRKDSLQGGLRPERTNYDVKRYNLNITINPDEKTIVGHNEILFSAEPGTRRIQVDLFANMNVDSIVYNRQRVAYQRDENAVFINFPQALPDAQEHQLKFYYSGKPLAAKRAPWDGGFDWKQDATGKHWVGVAVQGTGASLWFPVKDSQYDEPERGASVKVAVPNGLMNVSNGRFLGSEDLKNGYTRWDWEVKNPINNYNITVNIGDYVHIHDHHKGLDLDYYVIRGNEEKARTHFEEVKPMMDCFQARFGQYPFTQDGYKLVETPYLGMEHQSAVAYGNKYRKGYLGHDMSGSGVGMQFDYITIHETAHEWFGNSVTSKDIADMWIHEGFTTYAETVFVECMFGYEQAMRYINGQKNNISNDKPIIGEYGVNSEGSGDMYYKGSLMLNTLRNVISDDEKWWAMLLKYSATYRHAIIDTETVVSYFNKESQMNLTPIFNQYLRTTDIPTLVLTMKGPNLEYSWSNVVENFEMPVDLKIGDNFIRITPSARKKQFPLENVSLKDITVMTDKFLIKVKK